MTVRQLQSYDIHDFRNADEVTRNNILRDLNKTVKQRQRRLENRGLRTSAYSLAENAGVFNYSLRDKNERRQNSFFIAAQQFISAQTSTATGFKQWMKHQIEATGVEELRNLSSNELSEMFNLVEEVRTQYPGLFTAKYYSEQVVAAVETYYTSNSRVNVQEAVQEALNRYRNIM